MRRAVSFLLNGLAASAVIGVLIGCAPGERLSQVVVGDLEAQEHVIGSMPSVRAGRPEDYACGSSVEVELTVAADGGVIDAKPVAGLWRHAAAAAAAARKTRFTPFMKDQKPIAVTLSIHVSIIPEETWGERTPFPAVRNLDSLLVTLERGPCDDGFCPTYRIEIHGDGRAVYEGAENVAVTGRHEGRLGEADLRRLIVAFSDAGFFSLRERYEDRTGYRWVHSKTKVSIAFDGQSHAMEDLFGLGGGMPDSAYDLQNLIDSVTDSAKWVRGTADTVPALQTEGWDFTVDSEPNGRLLLSAARFGTVETVQSILFAGVSPNISVPAPKFIPALPSSIKIVAPPRPPETALQYAARRGDEPIVAVLLAAGAGVGNSIDMGEALSSAAYAANIRVAARLLSAGADPNYADDAFGSSPLMEAGWSGKPEIVKLLLAYGADAAAIDKDGRTTLMAAAGSGCASSGGNRLLPEQGTNRSEVIRLLLAVGADIKARDDEGRTALHSVHCNADAAKALLAAGADINAADNTGDTPIQKDMSSDVAMVLWRAGADMWLRDHNGRSGWSRLWPSPAEWLEEQFEPIVGKACIYF